MVGTRKQKAKEYLEKRFPEKEIKKRKPDEYEHGKDSNHDVQSINSVAIARKEPGQIDIQIYKVYEKNVRHEEFRSEMPIKDLIAISDIDCQQETEKDSSDNFIRLLSDQSQKYSNLEDKVTQMERLTAESFSEIKELLKRLEKKENNEIEELHRSRLIEKSINELLD